MRVLGVVLLLLGLVSAGVSPLLEQRYGRTRPTFPGPDRALEHHVRGGTVVYLTALEQWLLLGSFYGGVVLAVVGGCLYVRGVPNGACAAR